jgi:hypothetical protein
MSTISSASSYRWLALIGIVLYLIAPAMPTLQLMDQEGNSGEYPGWPLLYFGWIGTIGILNGKTDGIGWLGNPLFLLGTLRVLMGKRRRTTALLAVAVGLSLASFTLKEVLINEGGTTSNVVGYKLGFWLWMAAIWFNLFVSIFVDSISPCGLQDSEKPLN